MNSASTRCPSAVQVPAQFCRQLIAVVGKLKVRLQGIYEELLPGQSDMIHQAVVEAEDLAWETQFPHLLLPDFVEARLAELIAAREPAFARAA